MSSRIIVRREGRVLSEFPLAPSVTLGRHPSSSIQLEDPMMSRNHAKITVESGRVLVTDLNSTNGVKINGRRIKAGEPSELKSGDVLTITSFELVLELEKKGVEETHGLPPAPQAITATRPAPSPNLEHLLEHDIPLWTSGKEVELEVADIIEETHDVKTFRLVGQRPLLFSYKPGQFATLKLEIDGKRVNRSYTISSSPSRPHTLEFTVKRVEGGLVSNYLHSKIRLGDKIRLRGPAGHFSCFNYPSSKILCIGAGSGITPVMSMCRWIVDTTADVDVTLLVSARSPADIIYRRELELISSRHGGMRILVAVSSGGNALEPWTGLTGRITKQMLQMSVPDLNERHVFMCGPPPFMDVVRGFLRELEYPIKNLHTESFGAGRVAPGTVVPERDVPKARPPAPASVAEVAAPVVAAPVKTKQFSVSFKNSDVIVHTDGEACLLDLAEANGVGITSGCRSGACLVCRTKCSSGQVEMEPNSLPDTLKNQGYVLVCVGRPRSDLVLEA